MITNWCGAKEKAHGGDPWAGMGLNWFIHGQRDDVGYSVIDGHTLGIFERAYRQPGYVNPKDCVVNPYRDDILPKTVRPDGSLFDCHVHSPFEV